LSNTASIADYWLAPWPGTEAFLLLAMAQVILREQLYDRAFLESWVNWRDFLKAKRPERAPTFELFLEELTAHYAAFTPEAAEKECGVAQQLVIDIAREIGKAGSAFAA